MTPLIRRARPDDLPELGRLATVLVEEHYGYDARRFIAPTPRTPQSYATFLGSHLESSDVFVFVAEIDARVAGYVFVALEGFDYLSLRGPSGVLHDLLVSPEHRGHGIGRLLLEAALAELRARNAPRVVLSTAERNQSAQQLFERFGFRRTMVEMTCELSGDHSATRERG